jgi:hypothetical protein
VVQGCFSSCIVGGSAAIGWKGSDRRPMPVRPCQPYPASLSSSTDEDDGESRHVIRSLVMEGGDLSDLLFASYSCL